MVNLKLSNAIRHTVCAVIPLCVGTYSSHVVDKENVAGPLEGSMGVCEHGQSSLNLRTEVRSVCLGVYYSLFYGSLGSVGNMHL